MPKDIRSFFKPLSSKTSSDKSVVDKKEDEKPASSKQANNEKKKSIVSKLKVSPKKQSKTTKNNETQKKRIEVISSDDEFDQKVLSVKKDEKKSGSASPKKTTRSKPETKKREIVSSDSDTDIVEGTPQIKKIKKYSILSSDSEDETPIKTSNKGTKKNQKESLKPVDISKVFQNSVKQSKQTVKPAKVEVRTPKPRKTKKTEVGVHNDEKFEKTLLELDDDDDLFLANEDVLEKTINEAFETNNSPKKTKTTPESKPSPQKCKDTPRRKETPEKAKTTTEGKTPSRKRLLDDKPKDDTPSSKSKKAKIEHTDSGFDDQEKHDKKRYCAMMYQSYKNRSGPKNHGSKEYPKGNPNCLSNLCFLRTGVLDSLENEEFDDLVKKHGGRTVHAVSKKVDYVVSGEDPGPSKLQKAESYKIPIINEDQFLDIILEKSGKPKKFYTEVPSSFEDAGICDFSESEEIKLEENIPDEKKENLPCENEEISKPVAEHFKTHDGNVHVCLSEKYKPKILKEIIGHQITNSGMNKLKLWLENWEKNEKLRKLKKIKQPSPWDKNNDGSYYKCALLSGPPGVGKTTTANLVASSLNYDIVEFNASDTRSKRLLQEDIANALGTKTIANFNSNEKNNSNNGLDGKRVLLMDEVDGMAGNEDRGGMQELIRLIKISKIPIICMCNDRNHEKIRSLSNYCYDLRFEKPKPQQIMGFVMSVCCKEGIKMSPQIAMEIINGTGCDIRQTLNQLAMISNMEGALSLEQARKDSIASKKDTVLGPWQVTRMVFDENEQKNMTLIDKSRLFFYDYSFGPLFIQENYLKVQPKVSRSNVMKRVAAAAEAISKGATISRIIRESNNWSLMDTQAIYSSVLPGHYMSGQFGGSVDFPSFLGKLSRKNKLKRLQTELYNHTQMNTSGGASAIGLDYCKPLLRSIITPLKRKGLDGVREAVNVMKSYQLLREDLDSLVELATWTGQKNLMDGIDSKVKTAFTKLYNKEAPLFSHSVISGTTNKKKVSVVDANEFEEDDDEDEEKVDDNIENDKNIKVKTKTKAVKNDGAKPSTSKQRNSSKGRKK